MYNLVYFVCPLIGSAIAIRSIYRMSMREKTLLENMVLCAISRLGDKASAGTVFDVMYENQPISLGRVYVIIGDLIDRGYVASHCDHTIPDPNRNGKPSLWVCLTNKGEMRNRENLTA